MKIANNVEMLEIEGERGVLYPVLIWDDDHLVLVDTALPGQTELLKEAISKAGFSLEKITNVIITHQDMDHIGSAKTLAELGAEILAHETETPYIQGDETSLRITDMEKHLNKLNDGEHAFYERMKKGAPYFYVHVDRLLNDNETLDICGGLRVLHTPGHTPGHISLFLEQSNIIVAGDAANINDGALTVADPMHTRDMAEAQISFEKLMNNKPQAMVCYHGGYTLIG